MCEPTTIAMGVMLVVSAAVAMKSANDQKHAVEAQMKMEQEQTNQAASAQMEDRVKAAREARASARAAAAESGASGNSVDAVLQDISFQSTRDVSRIEKNRENGVAESTQQARSRVGEINGQLISSLAKTGATMAENYPEHVNLSAENKANTARAIRSDVASYKRDLSRLTIGG